LLQIAAIRRASNKVMAFIPKSIPEYRVRVFITDEI
jgi:hypothetical protein